jgi:hypothetical protein
VTGALADLLLDDYAPTQLDVDCRRCNRHASASTAVLKAKYGNPTLGEVARAVAADGSPPCNLASAVGNVLCSAIPIEPPVDQWAELSHALHGGWRGHITCHRHHQGLKATKSCPGPERLDVRTMVAVLGHDFRLERLRTRLQCPGCGSKAISIDWEVPPTGPPDVPVSALPEAALGETLHRSVKTVRSRNLRVVGKART